MIERFYQDNKVKDIRIGGERILRVLNQGKAVYPNVVRDGLVLHYDFRGYTNDNLKRVIAYDLSGSGNHGELKNFAFSEGSGYDGQGLVFDGVDDFIQLPELGLDADNFTVMINDNVVSYRGEQVAQVVDGDVEIGGRNLFKKSTTLSKESGSQPKHNDVNGFTTPQGWREDAMITVHNVFPSQGQYTVSGYYVNTYTSRELHIYIGDARMGTVAAQGGIPSRFEIQVEVVSLEDDILKVWAVGGEGNHIIDFKVEKGNKATDWTPAPEDFTTTQNQKPFFGDDIKTLSYWNRALSDSEILKMYNLYKNN